MAELLYPKLSYIIVGCIYEIRNQYGPGQKEVVYQRLLMEKLQGKKIKAEKEKKINVYSKDTGKIMGAYQPDIVADDKIVIELKSSRFTTKHDETQLYKY